MHTLSRGRQCGTCWAAGHGHSEHLTRGGQRRRQCAGLQDASPKLQQLRQRGLHVSSQLLQAGSQQIVLCLGRLCRQLHRLRRCCRLRAAPSGDRRVGRRLGACCGLPPGLMQARQAGLQRLLRLGCCRAAAAGVLAVGRERLVSLVRFAGRQGELVAQGGPA